MSRHVVRSVRETVRREYADVIRSIDDAADAATGRDLPARSSSRPYVEPSGDRPRARGRRVAERLRSELEARGALEALSSLLADAVAAAGCELPADPVPAAPYVVVTSRGPLARATIDPGRLVIRFDAFAVDRNGAAAGPPAAEYRRRAGVEVVVSLADRR